MAFKIPKISLEKKSERTHDPAGKDIMLETMALHQITAILLGTKRRISPHDIIVCGCEEQFIRSELSDHQSEQVSLALLAESYSIQRI